jgi:NADH dehydrogenase
VPTNPEMQVEGQDRLWAVGDCAAVPWEGKVAPPTAQFAMRQGDQLGQNLVRALRGETLQPFNHQFQGQLASIGHHEAVAEVFGFRFSGFIAWWLWRSAYLSKLPGLARKIRVMIDWTLELFFSRDISLVQPPAEEPLREVHVLKGEIVFRKGRPVRAFGFVRSGALRWKQDDGTETVLGPKSMVDQTYVDAEGLWKGDLIAEESSDLLIFRGKALTLLKKDLKITAR